MKIKPNDLAILKAAVMPQDTPELRAQYVEAYKAGKLPNVRDLDTRYRWDLLHRSKLKIGDGRGMAGDVNLYAYMNDDHVNTALKSFIPALVQS